MRIQTWREHKKAQRRADENYLREVLALTGGNVTAAAKIADYHRASFYVVLRRFGLHGAGPRWKKDR